MNGITSRRSAASVLGLAAIAVAIAGCNSDAALIGAPKVSVAESVPQDWYRGERPILRSQADAARSRIWVLTLDGAALYEASTGEEIAQIPLPGWLWVGEKYSCSPDLAIGPGGDVVISSNVVPTLWRIDAVTLKASRHELALDDDPGKDVGFTGLAYSAQQGAYFAVSPSQGALWRIDSLLRRAQSIPLSAPVPKACALAVPSTRPDRRAGWAVALCARSELGDSTINLAPDQRSGNVRPGQCVL